MKSWRMSAFVAFCCVLLSQQLAADVEQGFDWLSTQQQVDGHFASQNDIASEIQATQETLKAFEIADRESEINLAPAEQYLSDHFYVSSETASRLLLAGIESDSGGAAVIDALLELVNDDGGLGLFAASQTSPLETGYALQAFQLFNVSTASLDSAVASLLDSQNSDGGWGLNSSSVFVTSIVIRGLSGFAQDDAEPVRAFWTGR